MLKKILITLLFAFQTVNSHAQEISEGDSLTKYSPEIVNSLLNCEEQVEEIEARLGTTKTYRKYGNIALGAGVVSSSGTLAVGAVAAVPTMILAELFISGAVSTSLTLTGTAMRVVNSKSDIETDTALLQTVETLRDIAYDLADGDRGLAVEQYLKTCQDLEGFDLDKCTEIIDNIERTLKSGFLCNREFSEKDEVLN